MGGARFCILQREIGHLGAARGGPVLHRVVSRAAGTAGETLYLGGCGSSIMTTAPSSPPVAGQESGQLFQGELDLITGA
jgi:hypothetical protein